MHSTGKNKQNYSLHVDKFEGGIHNKLGQDSFNFINLKGQGAFGKVYKVKTLIHSNISYSLSSVNESLT